MTVGNDNAPVSVVPSCTMSARCWRPVAGNTNLLPDRANRYARHRGQDHRPEGLSRTSFLQPACFLGAGEARRGFGGSLQSMVKFSFEREFLRSSSAQLVEGRQVELAEARRVGEDIDFDDLLAPDRKAHD